MRDIIIKSVDNKRTMRLTFHWDMIALLSMPILFVLFRIYALNPMINQFGALEGPFSRYFDKLFFYALLVMGLSWVLMVIKQISSMSPARQSASTLGAIIILIAVSICWKLLSVGIGDNPDSIMFYPMIFGFIVAFLFGLALMVLEPEIE